jgi:tetratricopeptide (TPR) repeat protein
MKRSIILITLFALLLAGCDSFLDVKPQQSIDASNALTSSENVRLALNAAYVNIRNGYGQQLFHGAELMADNGEIFFQGTYLQPREYIGKSLVASSQWPEEAWQDMYKGIYICNQVLKHLDVVDEADLPQIKGEALFLRGLVYFDLARFYAPAYQPGGANSADAVPLMIENSDEMYPSRSTVSQVYDKAQADLEEAASLLSTDEPFFANKYAALAVLSRLYMTRELWAKAAEAANEIIVSGVYSLSETPLDAFNHAENTPEDIFAFQANNDDNLGSFQGTGNEGMSAFYASTDVTGRSDFAITNVVFDMYEPNDLRGQVQGGLGDGSAEGDIKSLYYEGFGNNNDGGVFCAKWLDYDRDMTFVRLAEIILTRAEANFMNSSEVGDSPLNDIKAIRDRAGVTTPGVIDIDFIRHERIRELIFEGQRLHDYKRWKWQVGDLEYNSPRLVFPIPQRERDVNENLTQNAGY